MFGRKPEPWLSELSEMSDDLNAAGYGWDDYQSQFMDAYDEDQEHSEHSRLPATIPVGIAAMKVYTAAAERQNVFSLGHQGLILKSARYAVGNLGSLLQVRGLQLAILVWGRKTTLGLHDPDVREALDEWSGGFQASSEGRWWVEQVVAGRQYERLGEEARHLVDAVGIVAQAKDALLASYPEADLKHFGEWGLA